VLAHGNGRVKEILNEYNAIIAYQKGKVNGKEENP
jgi:hypothetical protein